MEQKNVFLSALGVGVGFGVGLGLSGKLVGENQITAQKIECELIGHIIDGKTTNVTFHKFPHYISERTQMLLISAAYFHLNHYDISKHTRNLPPACQAVLLSGPTEFYQQMVAKALAQSFESKLLLLDFSDLSLKMQRKYGFAKKEPSFRRSIPEAALERVSSIWGSFSIFLTTKGKGNSRSLSTTTDIQSRSTDGLSNTPKHRKNASAVSDISSISSNCASTKSASVKRTNGWCFDEKLFLQSLYKVLVSVSKTRSIILYLRDVEMLLLRSPGLYKLLNNFLNKLPRSVFVIGSRIVGFVNNCGDVDDRLSSLFRYNVEIQPPKDEKHLLSWKAQLEEDMKMIQFQDNKNHIAEVLAANDLECDDLESISLEDTMVLSKYIEEIVASALSSHLINRDLQYRNGKLLIRSWSLSRGLRIFREGKDTLEIETNAKSSKEAEEAKAVAAKAWKSIPIIRNYDKNMPPPRGIEIHSHNEYEKRIRSAVIPANEIGVTFADIGSLDEIKESLQELVMLPLRRPNLFKGGLLKPCKGILLFGPPGTGKTMLAKAIASEAGASFINVSMSTITSKWFGEDEKNVKALFTLAAKVSPTIIFIDEVDSMLGQRSTTGEHECTRKIKNEFMIHWDGLLTRNYERILVLAATNRPFDLDEAIIRRFERRFMVGLPSVDSREKILKTLLSKEKTEDLAFKELATMTEGYNGSDLKSLCVTAAYRPVREFLQQEKMKDLEKKQRETEKAKAAKRDTKTEETENRLEDATGTKEEEVIILRPLNMDDMRHANKQVAASFSSEGPVMNELKQWNELYGEGGSRKREQLAYYI